MNHTTNENARSQPEANGQRLTVLLSQLARLLSNLDNSSEAFRVSYDTLTTADKEVLQPFFITAVTSNGRTGANTQYVRKTARLRGFLDIKTLTPSTFLAGKLSQWRENIDSFYHDATRSPHVLVDSPWGIGAIYRRKLQRRERSQVEVVRDRFDCLLLYKLAVRSGCHSANKWCPSGAQNFVQLVQRGGLDDNNTMLTTDIIRDWVNWGLSYHRWIEALSGADVNAQTATEGTLHSASGYLFILPQDIPETRELRQNQHGLAAAHLRSLDIATIAHEYNLLGLGQNIENKHVQCHDTTVPSGMARTDLSMNTSMVLEATFNQLSTLCHVRPYDSPIFLALQQGDLATTRYLLNRRDASIYDVDPYGLNLLYYVAHYCWKATSPHKSLEIWRYLIREGAPAVWRDDLGNSARYTLLDSMLISAAMQPGDMSFDIMYQIAVEDRVYCADGSDLRENYLQDRGFTPLHEVLLRLKDDMILPDFLHQCAEDGTLAHLLATPDAHYRTPLRWAIEYGWHDAARMLIHYGANVHEKSCFVQGHSTLLHVALAGPPLQMGKAEYRSVISLLLENNVDVNARDHEGWTPLHIAASWELHFLSDFLGHPNLDWTVKTANDESVDELSYDRSFSKRVLPHLAQHRQDLQMTGS